MKKGIILLFLLVMCAVTAIAGEPQQGYRGFIEWSNDIHSFKYTNDYSETFYYTGVSTSHGYQFNPNLFVGGGLAVERNINYDMWVLPVFAQVRTDQKWGMFTPFGDMRVGYNLTDGGGYFLSPTVGYRFNWGRHINLNVGVGLTLKGYAVEMYDIKYYDESDGYPGGYVSMTYIGKGHRTRAMFSLRIGIDF